jgi:hypothetical protein
MSRWEKTGPTPKERCGEAVSRSRSLEVGLGRQEFRVFQSAKLVFPAFGTAILKASLKLGKAHAAPTANNGQRGK